MLNSDKLDKLIQDSENVRIADFPVYRGTMTMGKSFHTKNLPARSAGNARRL